MTPTFFDVGRRRNWLKREASIEISRPAAPRAGSHIIRPSPSPLEEGAENGQNRVWMADDEKTGTTSHLTFQYFQFPWTSLARMVMAIFRVLTISGGPQNLVDLSSVGEGSWNKNTQRSSENTSADWHRFDKPFHASHLVRNPGTRCLALWALPHIMMVHGIQNIWYCVHTDCRCVDSNGHIGM